jgi:hypothetical protein
MTDLRHDLADTRLRKPEELVRRNLADQDLCDEGFNNARAEEHNVSTSATRQLGMRSRILAFTHEWLMEMGNTML